MPTQQWIKMLYQQCMVQTLNYNSSNFNVICRDMTIMLKVGLIKRVWLHINGLLLLQDQQHRLLALLVLEQLILFLVLLMQLVLITYGQVFLLIIIQQEIIFVILGMMFLIILQYSGEQIFNLQVIGEIKIMLIKVEHLLMLKLKNLKKQDYFRNIKHELLKIKMVI